MSGTVSSAALDGTQLAELMRRIADVADRHAFATLFELLAPRLKGYLMRLGTDDAAAEELVQDVMLTIWRRAVDFDPGRASVSTWAFTIARNRRIDRLRRERHPELDGTAPMIVPASANSAEEGIETAQWQDRLRKAIDALPREQAELLFMAYYRDMPHAGIAAACSLPLGTVKSRLRLALARLRRSLAEDGEP